MEKELDQLGEQPIHREGYRGGTWVLLDYGCVAVHVFNEEARAFYGLERLWSDGHALDLTGVDVYKRQLETLAQQMRGDEDGRRALIEDYRAKIKAAEEDVYKRQT